MILGSSVFPLFRYLSAVRFLLLALVAVSLTASPVFSQVPADRQHHDHAGMAMDEPITPAQQAKLLADKRESEFNHHLAGFFLVLAGLFILAETNLPERGPWVRFAWPVCFVLSGIFVLVWSDTELWPFGPQSWYFGLTHHPEVLQHKIFAVLLLVLGTLEFRRARGLVRSAWTGWVFPVLAIVGSSM